jgi:aspartate racemase
MQILGIVGGIAPASTIEYYRRIVDAVRTRTAETEYPRIIINSIDLRRMLPLFETGDREGAVALLVGELERLARAGADFAIFASNTPHLYFAEIANASSLPLLSIVDAVGATASERGLRRLLLLGTGFTMRATFYADALAPLGIEVVKPPESDLTLVHSLYMSHLVPGDFSQTVRDAVLAVIDRCSARERIDGVILGGTELPLLLGVRSYHGLELLDSAQIHIDRVVAELGATPC